MPVEGNIEDMPLTDIVQFNCRGGEEARVTLSQDGQTGAIYFAKGQVIHATNGREDGEEAFYQLLKWTKAHFIIEKDIPSPQKSIQIPWSALLLQGMKHLDEEREMDQSPLSRKEVEAAETVYTVLEELADSLNGFIASQLVGSEGQVVTSLVLEAIDEEAATASLASLVQRTGEALLTMEAGHVKETIILTEKYHIITRPIGQNQYHLWIILTAEGSIGAARMYLVDKETELLDILSVEAA